MGRAKRLTPHALRYTMATFALAMGTDVANVGELLRHADLNNTRRYLHLVDERRHEAVRRIWPTLPPGLVSEAPAVDAPPPAAPAVLDAQDGLDDVAAGA